MTSNTPTDNEPTEMVDDSEPFTWGDLTIIAEEVKTFVAEKNAAMMEDVTALVTKKISEASNNVKIDALATKVDTLLTILTKADAILAALAKVTDALTAPKTIVTDASGKPVGIRVAP